MAPNETLKYFDDSYSRLVKLRDGKPYVVDIHSFPGFKGVPDAALRLADYIYATARLAMAGRMIGGRDDDLAAPVAKARSA